MLTKTREFLGTQVDNSPLVLFRMFFGFLAAAESFGAIMTGWVHETFIEPEFTFNFIGFEWLQVLSSLPGNSMYYYFGIMGVMGLLIMLGMFYRFSAFMFFLMWSCVYLAQKSHYNNHYYLLMVLSAIMAIMPAHKSRSIDAKMGWTSPSDTCPQACLWYFILQVGLVYVFASFNKIHIDWLQARPIEIWFRMKAGYWLIGPLLQEKWLQYFVAWGGVLYDGTIVFLLLWKKTRKLGFAASLFFNLFNSAVFQIGIFPYLMIAFTVFFFPPETIRKIFFKKKPIIQPVKQLFSPAWTYTFILYFVIQVLLPFRPHLFKGDSHWTEEAHRLSWRMMLRAKTGSLKVEVVNKESGESTQVKLSEYVVRNQRGSMIGQPDMIWQFAQRLKQEYAEKGEDVAVYVESKVSLNGHPRQYLIDPKVDLASVPWEPWKHANWIMVYDSYYD